MPDEVYRSVAIDAAREAGDILLDWLRRGVTVEFKGTINLVTEADRAAETAIVKRIASAFPDHQILAEEGGEVTRRSSSFKWIIDPLDGTTNFTHAFPAFCVSIGLEIDGTMVVGIVYDPTRDELFVAEKGKGAWCNGRAISVSGTDKLKQALVVTGFSYDVSQNTGHENFEYFRRFVAGAQGVRRTGAAALDCCYVAMGRFDGFWEMKLKPWDMAAGCVIVTEAGGMVTDFAGASFSIYGEQILATNGRIHQEMVQVLAEPIAVDGGQ